MHELQKATCATQAAHHNWHASVAKEGHLLANWVRAPLRRGLEHLLRFSVAPTTATVLELCRLERELPETRVIPQGRISHRSH
jgi:hypothetical protein